MNRREFLATASGVAAAGFFPRVSLAHLGAHEGRFSTGGLTLISGYSAEGHHLVGQAVVELISRHVSTAKRSQLTVIASSADTLRLLRANGTDTAYGRFTVDLALVEGDEAYAALKGTGSQDAGGLRLLTLLPAQYLHIVTLSGSPIRSIGELKGKTVSVGPARSRSEKLTLRLLEALDPSVGTSLQRAALGLSESMWALAEKKIDALAWHGPVSPALFEHLAGLLKIRTTLLSQEEGVPKLQEKYGAAYCAALIRQGAYAGLEKDIHVVGTQNLLISRLDLPVQLAHDIVKTLDSHRDTFTGGDRRLSDISAGPETYMPFPVHPGALKLRQE
ncbi:MAG TPA: TAXI family TRAP transporter solute-binding subunit [Burkholderiales bacterium]|nr:TAXI family TRAP transporter solute-binding subunit [Burkholderiales bacterium]